MRVLESNKFNALYLNFVNYEENCSGGSYIFHIFIPFYKQHSRNFENLSENSIIRTDDMCFNSFCCLSNLHVLVILNMHLLIICKKKYTFSFSMQVTLYLDDENIFYVNNRESGLNKT